MPRLADLKKYVGNPALYARQDAAGAYAIIREPLTDDVLQAHLDGTVTVGTYTMDFDKAKHFVFDDDEGDKHGPAVARALRLECRGRGLDATIEWSGQKGYHVWVLLENWTLASDVQRLAHHIAKAVGFNGEVFPKQKQTTDAGNLVKLPYGVHRKSGLRSRLLAPEPKYVADAEFAHALATVPAGDEQHGAPSSASVRLPCLDSLFDGEPLREGERNDSLFYLACKARKWGMGDDQIAAMLATLIHPDDLKPGEFDGIIERSATYAPPRCEVLKPDRRCPEDLCVQTRQQGWKTQRAGEIKYAADGDSVVVRIKREGSSMVELGHPDLSKSRASLRTD